MNPNFLLKLLGSIKGLAITAIIPLVEAIDPAIGTALDNAAKAFSDSKITLEEAEGLAIDALNIAKEKLPHLSAGFDAVANFIVHDVPIITNTIVPDFEKVLKAFETPTA